MQAQPSIPLESRILELRTAAGYIKQTCEYARSKNRRPSVLMVGAGISYPNIPLASGITEHCKSMALAHGRTDGPRAATALGAYSHWFQRAYPSRAERQDYLRSLVENQPISAANLRLAHLMLDSTVANTVLTPNFDDQLSRGLNLFDKRYIVCDHPQTTQRIDPEDPGTQLIHIHGTYRFYDCCNLQAEVEDRAKHPYPAFSGMAWLVQRILENRLPLVVGYSGWEDDVFMTVLHYLFSGAQGLPHNLYWFCHRRSNIESLPDWLRSHANVFFVAPPVAPASLSATSKAGRVEVDTSKQETVMSASEDYADRRELTLDALDIFDELIRTFELRAPSITVDPIQVFADRLRSDISPSSAFADERDPYQFQAVIRRVEAALARDTESRRSRAVVDEIQAAVRSSRYAEAIDTAESMNRSNLSADEWSELAHSIAIAADGAPEDGGELKPRAHALVATLADEWWRATRDSDAKIMLSKALVNEGIAYGALGRSPQAIAAYDEVVGRFGDAPELPLRERVARALVNKGNTQGELEQSTEEIATYDEVIRRFGDAPELPLSSLAFETRERRKRLLASITPTVPPSP